VTPLFHGAGVALVTLFDERRAPDLAATAEHAAWLVDEGVAAVLVAGTTGEAARLTPDERRALLAAVRSAIGDRVPVIAGTGDPSATRALDLTRDAVAGGADAVLVHPPDDRDAAGFFAAVRVVAGEAQVLAYHFPGRYPAISVDELCALDVDGVKDSEGSAERLVQEVARWDGSVYTGSAALLPLAGPYGAAGGILALANLHPRLCAAAFGGDIGAQREMNDAHLAVKGGGVPVIKQRLAAARGTSATTR
jgi:4-hydroxy-tetrahydrodipicolinate synthase